MWHLNFITQKNVISTYYLMIIMIKSLKVEEIIIHQL